jgi:DNA ligase-1
MKEFLYGKDKKDSYKVWSIETRGTTDGSTHIIINHGQEGGKMTEKVDVITQGKQGRNTSEQATSEAAGRLKKQIDKGYRYTKEELDELPMLAMLAGDYNKIGHRITFPCYGSDKLDGVRCLAKKKDGVVTLESRTGQPYILPHVVIELESFMFDGEVLDGEIYLHGYALQDITSAVKRTDTQKEVDKAKKKLDKAVGSQAEETSALIEYDEALLIHMLRPRLEFIIFDIPSHNYDFLGRLGAMSEVLDTIQKTTPNPLHIKVLDYYVVEDDEHLRTVLHPKRVERGFEGVMLRNVFGMYESGKRSADLQKFKTFLDSEFVIVATELDSEGLIVFVCANDMNDKQFNVIMGSKEQKALWALTPNKFLGRMLTVKYQSRYKDTLLPQFPTGVAFRDGEFVDGEFVPHN